MGWLYALTGGVSLLATLLAIPVRIRFSAATGGAGARLEKGGRVRWGFGLVDLPLGGKPRAEPPPKAAKGKPMPRRTRIDHRKLLRNPAFWSRVKLLLRRLLRAVHWQSFRLDARIGLDDPADTGMLWGLIGPVVASAVPPGVEITARPDFNEAVLALESEGEIRVIPLRVLWVLALFFASPHTLRVLKPAWRRPA